MSEVLCVLRHPRKPAEAVVGRVCAHHAAALNEALQDILELWALLPLYLVPGSSSPDGSRHTKAAEAPAPGSVHVMSLRDTRNHAPRPPGEQLWWQETDDIIDPLGTLRERARMVAEARNFADRNLVDLAPVVAFLRRSRDWIAGQDWIQDYDDELHQVRKALTLGGDSRRPRPVGKCQTLDGDGNTCGGPLWPDRYGAMRVSCERCGVVFEERMLRHLGGMLDSYPQAL